MADKTEAETLALIEHYGMRFGRLSCFAASSANPARDDLIADADRLRELVLSLPAKTK